MDAFWLLALNSGWDPELLRLELGELKLDGFDLALTGFGELELGEIFADRTEGLTDPDDAPPAPEHPVSQKYLNNLIEQDHRGVKQRIAVMLGFKGFKNAAITIAGIELLHRIRKGQFGLGRLGVQGQAAPEVWNAVLGA
jgi:hypothetical protein